jgi:hypothetical protein
MTPTPIGLSTQTETPETPLRCAALCPLCQGRLIPLRDSVRCSRCGFLLCVGCADGEMAGTSAD